ncbi:MAG: hypothetical protein IH903_00945 [Proteobacteria bacterium]|nr:hypothetical protein [Pseudomonadota bacterium]
MSIIEIFSVDLLEIKPSSVGDYCESLLDSETLRQELLGDGPFGRKSFCAYLGIGESTLTGWLQSGRIPRVASEAYVLFLALQVMQEEIRRLEQEAENLKVVETNGKHSICKFRRGEDGVVLGQVLAENIPDLGTACALAAGASVSSVKLLQDCEYEIDHRLESLESGGDEGTSYWVSLQELRSQVEKQQLLLTDFEAWKLKQRPLSIDDF